MGYHSTLEVNVLGTADCDVGLRFVAVADHEAKLALNLTEAFSKLSMVHNSELLESI